jgi:hypothetical protein
MVKDLNITLMDIQGFINSINWNTPSWDLFIAVIFVAGIFLYTLSLGKNRVLVLLVSSYVSLALFSKSSLLFSQIGFNLENSFSNNMMIFIGGILLLFFILSNSIFASVFEQDSGGTWPQTMIMSFLQIGLMISVAGSFLLSQEASELSPFITSVFINNQAQFFWLVSPFVAALLFKK